MATVVALRWQEELVAALGLIGALLVPLMTLVEEGELTLIGTAFAALVFTAVAVVALRERWTALLIAGLVASFPQIAGLVLQSEPTDWAVAWLTVLFWALYVAGRRRRPAHLEGEAARPARGRRPARFGGARGRLVSAALRRRRRRLEPRGPGAARRLRRLPRARRRFLRRARDLATFFWAVGLTVGAVAAAELP